MKFSDLGLHPKVQAGVESQNFVDCTPIQEAAIPIILRGQDLAGLAQTGTGKTAAFLLPLMDRIVRSIEAAKLHHASHSTEEAAPAATAPAEGAGTESATAAADAVTDEQLAENARPIFEHWRGSHFALILVPTRELAEQVSENARKFGHHAGLKVAAIYGGTSYETQKNALKKGVQLVIATPGRLIDLFKEHLIDLNQVRAVVFDEADRMFDMGFKDDMIYILRRIPRDRQFLVFSATLNFDVLNVAYEFGANPVEVNVSRDQAKAENVNDEIFHVGQAEKPQFLLSLLNKHKPRQAIIFSNFKHNVERIAKFLSANGMPAMAISSLLTQAQRNRVMELFKADNEKNILVATDLAARGLDIKGVDMVANFELPDDPENYVHRIGRTGRAGATGLAVSLVSDRDVEALGRIENYLGHKITVGWLEDAEIVQEFKPFPQEDGGRPRFAQKDGGKRFEKKTFERRPERGAQGGGQGRQQPRRHEQRPQEARQGQPQQHQQKSHSSHPHKFKHTHRPAAAPVQPGLGARIKLFFKKLFGGGKPAVTDGPKPGDQRAQPRAEHRANGEHRPRGERPQGQRHHRHRHRHGKHGRPHQHHAHKPSKSSDN